MTKNDMDREMENDQADDELGIVMTIDQAEVMEDMDGMATTLLVRNLMAAIVEYHREMGLER